MVPIVDGDTADTLAARVLTVEHRTYPMALRLLAEGKVRMEGGRVVTQNIDPAPASSTLISPAV
ncbi:Phosphoribosylglycinamide formyltransferase [compost metagenome]